MTRTRQTSLALLCVTWTSEARVLLAPALGHVVRSPNPSVRADDFAAGGGCGGDAGDGVRRNRRVGFASSAARGVVDPAVDELQVPPRARYACALAHEREQRLGGGKRNSAPPRAADERIGDTYTERGACGCSEPRRGDRNNCGCETAEVV